MEMDIKVESRKQYLGYFKIWFIIAGILLVVSMGICIKNAVTNRGGRTNMEAPTGRVYDYANVLTANQEVNLREVIAKAEKKYKIDIVIVTTNQPMEGESAKETYGYASIRWEQNMRDVADDFWDEHKFGFNKAFEGDGVLLLSNWFEGQAGEHLSTSGSVEMAFGTSDINHLLDRVGYYIERDPYQAYLEYVDAVCDKMSNANGRSIFTEQGMVVAGLVLSTIVALIYMSVHMHRKKAKDTTTARTYVAGGRPVLTYQADRFIRKHVVSRRIDTSSGSGSSRGGGGGGGHHRSSSGASHGGGSRRR